MKKKTKIVCSALISSASILLISNSANAVCPVCTVAVAAGVGLSRWLGIDDTIAGLWIGGLTVSLITWTNSWLHSKKINFNGLPIAVGAFYYGLIVLPLWWSKIIGHPMNTIWGIDKLIMGIVLGGGLFYLGCYYSSCLKEKNQGKSHFPFQKTVFAITPLLLFSAIFYFITKQ